MLHTFFHRFLPDFRYKHEAIIDPIFTMNVVQFDNKIATKSDSSAYKQANGLRKARK